MCKNAELKKQKSLNDAFEPILFENTYALDEKDNYIYQQINRMGFGNKLLEIYKGANSELNKIELKIKELMEYSDILTELNDSIREENSFILALKEYNLKLDTDINSLVIEKEQPFKKEELEPNQKEMIDGIVEMLNQVEDIQNRKEMAMDRLRDFKEEGIEVNPKEFLQRCGIDTVNEKWSAKYKRSINCSHPKGFSQKAHCQGRKKKLQEAINESIRTQAAQLKDIARKYFKLFTRRR